MTAGGWAEWLAGRLLAPDPGVRAGAAYALTRSPLEAWRAQADAVRGAFDALPGDPARADLARALGRLGDPADVGRLADALGADPDWRTRVEAAKALQTFPDDAAARSALARAVEDANAHVAQTAAQAFAAVAGDAAAGLALAGRPWQATAPLLPALAATDPAAVLSWARRFSDEPFAQAAALRALGAATDADSLRRLFASARAQDPAPPGPRSTRSASGGRPRPTRPRPARSSTPSPRAPPRRPRHDVGRGPRPRRLRVLAAGRGGRPARGVP